MTEQIRAFVPEDFQSTERQCALRTASANRLLVATGAIWRKILKGRSLSGNFFSCRYCNLTTIYPFYRTVRRYAGRERRKALHADVLKELISQELKFTNFLMQLCPKHRIQHLAFAFDKTESDDSHIVKVNSQPLAQQEPDVTCLRLY